MFKTYRPLFNPYPRIRPLEHVQYPNPRAASEAAVPLFTRIAVRLSDRPAARAAGATA